MFIQTGCDKSEDVITPVDENVDKEATTSKNFVEITKALTDANSYLKLYLDSIPPPSFCPNYFYDGSLFGAIVVTYGEFPGCTAVDNIRKSGHYILTSQSFAGGDSVYTTLSFNDFRIYKYTAPGDTNVKLNGFMNFSTKKISGTTYNFHTSGEAVVITFDGTTKTINLSGLNGTVNYNSPNTVTDDTYSLYGSCIINDSGFGTIFNIAVSQANSLQMAGNCHYPLTGIAQISGSGGASCDFSPNANACDAIVKFTKGATTKTVDLSSTNF
ncbi:unnamed protein product [Rotaria sp. Silwood1]|nr:unnamed protein product [Rotaria sp. Silwood1]CAF4960979.1 unnamed protein product [Rotaria sp. Silwood1]